MKEIETLKNNGKTIFKDLKAPPEMEKRLYLALASKKKKQVVFKPVIIAASLLIVFLLAYNFNALAYYGRRILGFDDILYGTLKDLNEIGNGQIINKEYSFSDGTKIILDGVMSDKNQIIAFITLQGDNTNDLYNSINFIGMNGLFRTYQPKGGMGRYMDDGSLKAVFYFEAPTGYEKNLNLRFSYNSSEYQEGGNIRFALDRNKAMSFYVKETLDHMIETKNSVITLNEISISPTMTLLKGTVKQNDPIYSSRFHDLNIYANNMNISISSNGDIIKQHGGSMSTRDDISGFEFSYSYDTVPNDSKEIEIRFEGISEVKHISKTIPVDFTDFEIEGINYSITNVDYSSGKTFIKILTDSKQQYVVDAYLRLSDNTYPLAYIDSISDKNIHEAVAWIFAFEGIPEAEDYALCINSILVYNEYNDIIYLSVGR